MSVVGSGVRILIGGGTRAFRRAIGHAMRSVPGIAGVVEARTCAETLRRARDLPPDLIFFKDDRKRGSGDPAPELAEPPSRTILCVDALDDEGVAEAIRRGADGVIDRWDDPAALAEVVQHVAAGQVWISRNVVSSVLATARRALRGNGSSATGSPGAASTPSAAMPAGPAPAHLRFRLTAKQLAIIRSVIDGLTNREIARRFSISENTVKHHLKIIFDKLGVHNRLELAMFAAHHRLTDAPAPAVSDRSRESPVAT